MISFDFHDNSEGGSQRYCYLTNGEGEAKESPELTQGCITIQEIESFQVLILPFAHPWLTDSICCGSPGQSYKWPIVCVLSREMALGTHLFVCLWAVTQPAPAPLNVKGTTGSKPLSIHVFGIITKVTLTYPLIQRIKILRKVVSLGFGFLNCKMRLDLIGSSSRVAHIITLSW